MLILLCAAVAPALILMWFVYHRDFNPEPVNLIAKGFLYGAIATFASTLISQPLAALGAYTQEPHSIVEAIKISFFGAGIPEETAKLVMLWLLLRNCREFDERYDGIVYAVSVGLGFATLENIMYVVSAGADWFSVSISRAMFAVPGHFSFAVIMGYYYSKYHFMGPEKSRDSLVKAWLYPVLLHGTYDSIVFISNLSAGLSAIFSLILIGFCFVLFNKVRARVLSSSADDGYWSMIMRNSAPEDDAPDEQ